MSVLGLLCLSPIISKSVSSTYMMAKNVIVASEIADRNVALKGTVARIESMIMLITTHIGPAAPFPYPPLVVASMDSLHNIGKSRRGLSV